MNQALCICPPTPIQSTFFGFCLLVFLQNVPPQRLDCVISFGDEHKASFPKTQRRIASSRIEPGLATLRSLTRPSTTELWPPHQVIIKETLIFNLLYIELFILK